MKNKIILLSFLCLTATAHAQLTNPAPYCEARIDASTMLYNDVITAVHISTLSNSTGTTYYNGSDYVYYNNIPALSLQKGATIPATFTINRFDLEMDVFWVYIDYNMNQVFDATELVGQAAASQFTVASSYGGNVPISFNLNIPATAQNGQTRMRLMYTSDNAMWSVTTPTACNSNTSQVNGPVFLYGEMEDYNVTITGQTVSAPVASFSMAGAMCKNQSYALTDNSTNTPTAWSWTITGGTPSVSTLQNPTVKYANPGTYTVMLSSGNAGGSSPVVSKTVTVSTCTGIGEEWTKDATRLSVYPNPGDGYFNVTSPEALKILIHNVCGVKLLEQSLEPGKSTVDLRDQPRGIYFITAYGKTSVQSMKLIKE